jgi:hypothetical protein
MQPSISRPARGYLAGAAILTVSVFLLAATAHAQSGRRAPARTTTVPTISGPKTVEKKPDAPPADTRTSLVIAVEEQNTFSRIPYYLSGTIRDTCGDALRKSPLLKVDIASREMNHADAVKRAKAEKETYVVWLQLGSDSFDSGRSSSTEAPQDLYIRYTILSPVTAKVKSSGRTYQRINRTGQGGVLGRIPGSQGSSVYSEYALKQAAKEAAERILDALEVNVPTSPLPGYAVASR